VATKLKWNGDAMIRQIEAKQKANISRAAIHLMNLVKSDISQAGTLRYSVKTKKGTDSKKQKTIYNFTHSKPGNPPYKQTGHLRRSIAREIVSNGFIARVGSNLKYARHLEMGTRKMAARPFLRKNLDQHHAELMTILAGKAGGSTFAVPDTESRSGVMGSNGAVWA